MEFYEGAIIGGSLLLAIFVLYRQHFSKDRNCGCGSGKSCASKTKKV
ncbi:MAG: hypothetical protein ACTTJS_06990 [Wolinella sp.]